MKDFVAVSAIERFLKEEEGEAHDPALGWPERRVTLLDLTTAVRARPGWEEKIREGLESSDQQTFRTATQAARALGLDIWAVYFERTKRGEGHWYFVMQTDDPARIDRVVRLAEEMSTARRARLRVGRSYGARVAVQASHRARLRAPRPAPVPRQRVAAHPHGVAKPGRP